MFVHIIVSSLVNILHMHRLGTYLALTAQSRTCKSFIALPSHSTCIVCMYVCMYVHVYIHTYGYKYMFTLLCLGHIAA